MDDAQNIDCNMKVVICAFCFAPSYFLCSFINEFSRKAPSPKTSQRDPKIPELGLPPSDKDDNNTTAALKNYL